MSRISDSLLEQVREHRLVEESQVDYTKNRGFVYVWNCVRASTSATVSHFFVIGTRNSTCGLVLILKDLKKWALKVVQEGKSK